MRRLALIGLLGAIVMIAGVNLYDRAVQKEFWMEVFVWTGAFFIFGGWGALAIIPKIRPRR